MLRTLPIRLSDNRDLAAIERISRAHVADGGKLIVIDQLTMIEAPGADVGFQQATAVSAAIRRLARDLHVPIVVVCQVNRPAAKGKDHLTCNDIRDSGTIENDAAGVILIDKARKPDGQEWTANEPVRYLQLIIGKSRYSGTTDPELPIELCWWPRQARIESVAAVGEGVA